MFIRGETGKPYEGARCEGVRAQTSPYLWLLTALSAFPAILFWNHTPLLMGFCVAFVYFYCQIYWSIVHFRSPKWLMRRIPLPASDVVENEAGRPG